MARDTSKQARASDAVAEDDVAAFLRRTPDFLVRHPDLIAHLTPPSVDRGRGVVDFQAFLAERLRQDLRRVTEQQQELIGTTRANLNSQNRIHAAILVLLDAGTFAQLIQAITTDLAILLNLDAVTLIVESNGRDLPHVHESGVRVVPPGTIAQWLGRRDVVLAGDLDGGSVAFPGLGGLIRSQALIRLRVSSDTPDGVLAFGSREAEAFHPGQGTELVGFLARVIERLIRSWLDLPR